MPDDEKTGGGGDGTGNLGSEEDEKQPPTPS